MHFSGPSSGPSLQVGCFFLSYGMTRASILGFHFRERLLFPGFGYINFPSLSAKNDLLHFVIDRIASEAGR